MKLLDLTLDSAYENVALDEALLESAEAGGNSHEVLRLWQPQFPIAVLGRSSPSATEVDEAACQEMSVKIVRRCSGGATILTSPGCLMYAVLLSYKHRPELKSIDNAHQFVMQRVRAAISRCGVQTELQGICDLTIDDRKVSGNALRCKRRWLIYHGTLICESMDLELISHCLGDPRRQPEYRSGRTHAEFLTRIPLKPQEVADALQTEWECESPLSNWPERLTNQLVAEKYVLETWTKKV